MTVEYATADRASPAGVLDALRRLDDMTSDLSPMQAKFVTAVLKRPGISAQQVCDVLWGDDPAGGPHDVKNCLAQTAHKARKRLRPHGYTVKSVGFRWYVERIEA